MRSVDDCRRTVRQPPSDDCACSCCGKEGWVSAAGIVWDWAGSESGQAWRETHLSTMRRGAGLEWVDENVRRAAESSGRHIVHGLRLGLRMLLISSFELHGRR